MPPIEHVGEAGLLRTIENLVDARPPHVGVDQQHALSGLRERHRDVRRDTMLLPSPGPALVTTMLRMPSSADENNTLVRMLLNASAKLAATSSLTSGIAGPFLSRDRGNHAEERHADGGLELLRRLDPVVELLEEEREADGEQEAECRTTRSDRAERSAKSVPRGVSASSTTRTFVLLRSLRRCPRPSCAAAGSRRSGGCSPASRCSTLASIPLRFMLSASPFCESSAAWRLRSCATAAWYSFFTDSIDLGQFETQLRIGALDGRVDLDHLGVARRRSARRAAPAAAADRPGPSGASG